MQSSKLSFSLQSYGSLLFNNYLARSRKLHGKIQFKTSYFRNLLSFFRQAYSNFRSAVQELQDRSFRTYLELYKNSAEIIYVTLFCLTAKNQIFLRKSGISLEILIPSSSFIVIILKLFF